MEAKLEHVETNARATRPDPRPTVFSEREVNAYLASDRVQLPAGVESVELTGTPQVITGKSKVNFDRVRQGSGSSNPLLSMFSGVHDVLVVSHAYGAQGVGHVHVDSVSLDGVEVPRFVLELFVEHFLQPKYPELGLDSEFRLPDRVDTATIGLHRLTLVQR